jgi:tRNA-splicing endonuclease subunit Sen2
VLTCFDPPFSTCDFFAPLSYQLYFFPRWTRQLCDTQLPAFRNIPASLAMATDSPTGNGHAPELTTMDKAVKVNSGDTASPQSKTSQIGSPSEKPSQQSSPQSKKSSRKKKGKNYNQIHSRPLPLETFPLPAFNPSHPGSLLRLCYVWLSRLLYAPSSHPTSKYVGYFSSETRSVHVTDPKHVRALWEMGFFGKGSLSRSEPSWLDRAKAKVKAERGGFKTAEENTNARREERRLFKLERARLEREKIERQRAVEEGRMTAEEAAALDAAAEAKVNRKGTVNSTSAVTPPSTGPANGEQTSVVESTADNVGSPNGVPPVNGEVMAKEHVSPPDTALTNGQVQAADEADEIDNSLDDIEPEIANEEHLQLTLEEAFFLFYGLGVLDIAFDSYQPQLFSASGLLQLFTTHSTFPPNDQTSIQPDNAFLINYVVYHHFRSLGWVVRPGVKFAVDYLLYNRGPVFSHAEFALIISPAYSDEYWQTKQGLEERRIKKQKDWWWLHSVNRVQSQVKKTLVLVYVDIPAPLRGEEEGLGDVGKMLKRYRVREFIVRRWLANRSRD